ncbi:hypothetical protein HMPREF3038_02947 [Akkermansia sp. KLE1797]|nr:hypothetical protein HMPREF3038_02947 [Akkermansia sp. KLE1797]KXU52757.1 hypothetical protein HMPREF3039_03108 [Akkermansia sp. KLE1798]KZA04016.1 hypothetical protein HMPREF1326_02211 [Akkermansia sp. KLE1605]
MESEMSAHLKKKPSVSACGMPTGENKEAWTNAPSMPPESLPEHHDHGSRHPALLPGKKGPENISGCRQ